MITLLFQTRPGLEVCPGLRAANAAEALDDDKWFAVDPIPGAITCNLGDALQYWTDGRIKSTYHRVRVPRAGEFMGDRYSLAYFANAGLHTPLQGPSKRYPAVTFLDLLEARKQRVPMAMDPLTGVVGPDAMRAYQSYVAGPEVAALAPAGSAPPRAAQQLARIDLADFDTRKHDIARDLLAAAENEGFFYLVNHGVPQHEVDAAFALSRSFFASPDEVKYATRGDNSNAHYVLGYSTEELDEGTMRQGMLCGASAAPAQPRGGACLTPSPVPARAAYDNSRMAPLWPSEEQLPGFKQARFATAREHTPPPAAHPLLLTEPLLAPPSTRARLAELCFEAPAECICGTQRCLHFMRLLDGVVVKLMRCFALALELPEDHFTNAMSPDDDDNGTALFFNRYPSVEGRTFPAGAVRDACAMVTRYALL